MIACMAYRLRPARRAGPTPTHAAKPTAASGWGSSPLAGAHRCDLMGGRARRKADSGTLIRYPPVVL